MDANANIVKESSVCILIEASVFNVRRAVPRKEVVVESAAEASLPVAANLAINQKSVAVGKDLINSPKLREIGSYDAVTRDWIKSRSVPSELIRSGAYMVSTEALPIVYEYLESRAPGREKLLDQFVETYVGEVQKAKTALGPLFKASQYPAADAIRAEFSFTWRIVEIGTPDAKLKLVSRVLFEKERAKAEEIWSNSVGLINQALAEGLASAVDHLAAQLGGGDDGKPKRLHETAVKKMQSFLEFFESRNLAKNADLSALADRARMVISGVDAKQLRSEEGTRKSVLATFTEIKGSLDKMLADRPARAVTFSDDEV